MAISVTERCFSVPCPWMWANSVTGFTKKTQLKSLCQFLSLGALSLKALNCHIRSLLTLSPLHWRDLMACRPASDSLSPLQCTGHMSQAIWTLWTCPSDRQIPLSGWHHNGHHVEPMNHPPEFCLNSWPTRYGWDITKCLFFSNTVLQGGLLPTLDS